MFFDLPLEQLREYRPERTEPADFDAFWSSTLASARSYPLNPVWTRYDAGLRLVETFDCTFKGFGGDAIKGWFILPRQTRERLPCVVEFIGYGGGRGYPFDWLTWSNAGYAHFIMDTRGQGSVWSRGDTPDAAAGTNPEVPGFMTRGVLSPETYYYRRVFTDAIRAVETVRSHPSVDPDRVVATGGSQGGGIALATAGLDPSIAAVMPDVPFLCHFRVAAGLVDTYPYREISQFCQIHREKVETVFTTLSYFDGVNFAARGKTPALFSVGLMDDVCPPRTVFAAYNHYAGPKEIRAWEYNRHEGGATAQLAEKINFLRKRFA